MEELSQFIDRRIEDAKSIPVIDDIRDEVFITPGQVNRATNTIEQWFGQFDGEVLAELNFIDKTTFGFLDTIPKKCGIRIITQSIKDKEKCKRNATQCAKDRPHFEIIKVSRMHQRWIGSLETFIVDIGTDLKTDALGKRNHAIRRLDPTTFKETIKMFNQFWDLKQKKLQELYGSSIEKSIFFP